MTLDRSFIERNRLSTERIRSLAARLSDQQMLTPVGEHWTVAIVFAHLAFWDRRVMFIVETFHYEHHPARIFRRSGQTNDGLPCRRASLSRPLPSWPSLPAPART
jgi:hypothetical protein